MNKHFIAYAILFVIILILLNSVLTSSTPSKASAGGGGAGSWKVYGTNGCGWTRKQLKSMEDKNSNHKFVDCDKEDCGDVSAFPTTKDSDGKTTVGFDANLG